MTEQEWTEWRAAVEREEVNVQTVRNGGRTWQVRWTWRGRGTRQVRIVRCEVRRAGWSEGVWREHRGGMPQCRVGGQVVAEVWA